jgi:uncharacterized membrane protein
MTSGTFIRYTTHIGQAADRLSERRIDVMTLSDAICIVMVYDQPTTMSLKEREVLFEARKIVRENAERALRAELKKNQSGDNSPS